MTEKRVQINKIVANQLPSYVKDEFPLILEFLKQYYIGQEYQGAPLDLIQNIDDYIKLDTITDPIESTILTEDLDEFKNSISVLNTNGFPTQYGLIKIDQEIITYTNKTNISFEGCIRGFSGITSYRSLDNPENLVFSQSKVDSHSQYLSDGKNKSVENISILFFKEFLRKIKYQLSPGFEDREFATNVKDSLFLKQSKDFYSSKGTNQSFEILFKVLYGENVKVIRPGENVIKPSDANYRINKDIVVESLEGDPTKLVNITLHQDSYKNILYADNPVTRVEKISAGLSTNQYYKLSLDVSNVGNINKGSDQFNNFSIHAKTKLIGEVSIGSTILNVDSTVGFPNNGTLSFTYANGTVGIASYASKNITQFLKISSSKIQNSLVDGTELNLDTYAYAGEPGTASTNSIKVRIRSVLNKFNIPQKNYYYNKGDQISIKTLGILPNDISSNNWLFNTSQTHIIEEIILIDSTNLTYKVTTKDNNIFKINDQITFEGSSKNFFQGSIIDIFSNKTFVTRGQGKLNLSQKYTIKRNILKTSSLEYPTLPGYTANIQNIYKNGTKTIVASLSLPYYNTNKLNPLKQEYKYILTGVFLGDTFEIIEHNFYNGDSVYYTPEKSIIKLTNSSGVEYTEEIILSSLFGEGLYFVQKVNQNNIKLAKSLSDLYNKKFITLTDKKTINQNIIQPFNFKGKYLSPQNLLREIDLPKSDGKKYQTKSGSTGILINGTEILNYKSTDQIYYGEIQKIDVLSAGEDYDVINPPVLNINDSVGTGATAYCSVKGEFKEIKIIDAGFDFISKPNIEIYGGNGIGAKAEANLKLISYQVPFNSSGITTSIDLTNNTIGFSTYHKFRTGEKIIYKTFSQTSVGGLSTDAVYYASILDSYRIKLHTDFNGSIVGTNIIDLTSYGFGNHSIKSFDGKYILGSITIIDSGVGYENKKRTCFSSGINTSLSFINIENHDYKTGEIITYSVDGSVAIGLATSKQYYVTTVDNNTFKLSEVGIGTTTKNFYFSTNQYADIKTVGVGTHTFNYPNISVNVIAKSGISSISENNFTGVLQPIVRGEITSVHLVSKGVGYGSSEILNYNKPPNFNFYTGSKSQLTPIISNGKIVEVVINVAGQGYNSPPKLKISGNGKGAKLTPIISSGQITSIIVNEGGLGYDSITTKIEVIPSGKGAVLSANLKRWTVNLFTKYVNNLDNDDGVLTKSINNNYGLQYTHLYAPRELRKILYASDQSGNILYGKKDLKLLNDSEIDSSNHSPIIGWAYDGNPIYGPYGYIKRSGGIISQMKSGYILNITQNRPPVSTFPQEFFIEDFIYVNSEDETVLDENNGRFCITPEFPNGVYAYFSTLNLTVDSNGVFKNYKKPTFPYLIGNNYNSKPNNFNFDLKSNQDEINLNTTGWMRNTYPYNFTSDNSYYTYVTEPNDLKAQKSFVKYAAKGSINSIGILTGGSNYQVNDVIVFNNDKTEGYGASAKVSKVFGKSINNISVASTFIDNVEFYPSALFGVFVGFATIPHSLKNKNLVNISGLNTTSSFLYGSYEIGLSTSKYTLTLPINNSTTTGIVTYFPISGDFNFNNIRENDIFSVGVGTEKIKVLNVDAISSRIRVLREFDSTVGVSHTASTSLGEVSRKLQINVGYKTTYDYRVNKEIYFNPSESVGIGTIVGVGITLTIANPGVGITQIFVPSRAIYLPNHGLQTGDELTYFSNSGTVLGVSTTGVGNTYFNLNNQSIVYTAKISNDFIGISTVKIGIGSTGTFCGVGETIRNQGILYFLNSGSNVYHSFKTNYPSVVKGKIFKNLVTVSLASTHGLLNEDIVYIDVNPSISTTFTLKYDNITRRTLVNSKNFIATGINTSNSNINILSHGFVNGQKVLHTSSSPCIGLENNKLYNIFVIDPNNIKLTENSYQVQQVNPITVGISSTSFGTLSPINPPIEVYKNSSIIFDVSDSSLSYSLNGILYPAFELEFYKDSNFSEKYETNKKTSTFDVIKTGIIGVTSGAIVKLNINQYTPKLLYYKLVPLRQFSNPDEKKQAIVDDSINGFSQIQIKTSKYSGKYNVLVPFSTSFTYNVLEVPESTYYSSDNSSLRYVTESSSAYGTIENILIQNKGISYSTLPGISTVLSRYGTGSILEVSSLEIGNVKTVRISDIGFDYPVDFTLKPTAKLPEIMKVLPLSSFKSIGVSSFGYGYNVDPKLVVIDGTTKKIISDVDLKFSLTNSNVQILKNTSSLNNTIPIILPTQNSNGVSISNIQYNSTTKNVTVTLSVGFSTADSFPFAVNDKVMIENISVGVGSTGKGYNSKNYDYSLFTLKSVYPNIGGIGIVTYSLEPYLIGNEFPGIFDNSNSSGRIIPEKYFPKFNTTLQKGQFLIGEKVTDGISEGFVASWNSVTEYLKIVTSKDFNENTIVEGKNSRSKGLIKNIIKFDSTYDLNSFSIVENGWEYQTGFLNDDFQRIHDNEYYQNFSYSLKSKIPYETWNDAVSTLNHTLGFRKFGNLQIESTQNNIDSMIPSFSKSSSIKTDFISIVNLNCVDNFDLVYENSLTLDNEKFSDQIIFDTRILQDYQESVGNRVLLIDDISNQFNSTPGFNVFVDVSRSLLSSFRTQKFFTYVKDRRYTSERQAAIVTILRDDLGFSYINQYGRVDTVLDLGSFDFYVDGTEGVLRFYPNKYVYNNYDVSTVSYNLDDAFTSIGNTNFGGVVSVATSSVSFSGISTIVSITSDYSSAKVLVCVTHKENNQFEYSELNLVHDGINVSVLEYGQLTNHSYFDNYSSAGLGTYYPYISGTKLNIEFIPAAGISTVIINTFAISIGNTSSSGIGTIDLNQVRLEGSTTSIASSTSPTQNVIASYPDQYDAAYFIVQASNTSNGNCQLSEIILVDDGTETYLTEYGNIETSSGIGTISSKRSGDITQLTFTPIPNINVQVKVFMNALVLNDKNEDIINFNNGTIETAYGAYYGTSSRIKKDFDLKYQSYPIFKRNFAGNDSNIVDITNDTIFIPNHFFVTGEELVYNNSKNSSSISTYVSEYSVGIGTTTFVGIGTTNKLPSSIYAIKIDINKIKLATSAGNALKTLPQAIDLVSVGIGTTHSFTAKKQNQKVIVSIDNMIQSPIVSTALTSSAAQPIIYNDEVIYFTGITSFSGGDLIKIDDEIMRINSIGIGTTNAISVGREILGTVAVGHASESRITKILGDYNIVENTLNFIDAPYGNTPLGTTTNPPNERDWLGITSSSSFQGRVFLRSGETDSTYETYYKNYIFDDISSRFDGQNKTFSLKSNNSNVSGISTGNAIILINNILQGPNQSINLQKDYGLTENVGITSITFTGTASSVSYDPNNANIPVGGVIISVGSISGFGYQPLVSAGGTSIVSAAGTISAISIGNSGSGYRVGVQTVRVGVALSSTGTPSIEFIGTAAVSNGNIVSIAITNPGVGYTSTNPPYVVIDFPLSYSNIPLIYSSTSSGNGAQAKVNIVVGQGSSVIDFEITNTGYGYGIGETLTVASGGATGIPTTPNTTLNEFQLSIQQIDRDKFTGWSIGELQILDDVSNLFNGTRVTFPIQYLGNTISIQSSPGSNIKIQDTLLIFINDVLQVPGKGYIFNGGSNITFTESPKVGDTLKLIFYRGSGSIDVIDRDIIETVKIGDSLQIGYDPYKNQPSNYQENKRSVVDIISSNVVSTNPYYGPGNISDTTITRPVTWCRQTEDLIINSKIITKDRTLYEPLIYPSAYLIQSVGIGSTVIYVDNLIPFFNAQNENTVSLEFQKSIDIISQNKISGAIGTAIVSGLGTITSVSITDGGVGYTTATVSFASTIGVSNTAQASGSVIISAGGTVTGITITNSGVGYTSTNPPQVLISSPTLITETNKVSLYSGDSGIVVGFGTTTQSSIDKLILDLFIPHDSFLRNSSLVGTVVTLSGISTGDYFVVYNSNVGFASTSLTSKNTNNDIIGIGTEFIDNVYQVDTTFITQSNVIGIGTTNVRRIYARITGIGTINFSSTSIKFDSSVFTFDNIGSGSGFTGIVTTSQYFGNYSWGKIHLTSRSKVNNFDFYGNRGVGGITTSAIVQRSKPLKFNNYL